MQDKAVSDEKASLEYQLEIDIELVSSSLKLSIKDSGHGIQNSENLFTPFYSTKTQGSGIGLLMSRQIIEAHDGYISIGNRKDIQGCIVEILLPINISNT